MEDYQRHLDGLELEVLLRGPDHLSLDREPVSDVILGGAYVNKNTGDIVFYDCPR
ncbi:MAG: hypothetical protein ABIH37_02590 [archaeon]